MSDTVISTSQIETLKLDRSRPLLLCDVDEVVVHFLKGFEGWLDQRDLWLDPASFALNGNIKYKLNGQPLEDDKVGPAIMGFFEDLTHELQVIEGAVESLHSLSEVADIVMLTNLPLQFRQARIANLAGHGLHFPVVTNSGPKGPAIAAIAGDHEAPVIFIDDHVGYLKSASEHLPSTVLVHFMQDERFGRHVKHEDYIHHRTNNWADAHQAIKTSMLGAGHRQ